MLEQSNKTVEKLPTTPEHIRSFGLGLAFILLAVWALKLFYFETGQSWTLLGLVSFFTVTSLFVQPLIKPLYQAWIWLAHKIAIANTYIILFIVYYFVLTPIALTMRLFGKHPLPAMGPAADSDSYWIVRTEKAAKDRYEKEF